MSTPVSKAPAPEAAVRVPGRARVLLRSTQTPVVQIGEMARLLARVSWLAVSRPVGYWGEVRDQMVDMLRLCTVPLIVSTLVFGFGAPGLVGSSLFGLFGIPERLGSFLNMATIREFSPWVNAMVLAGVVGTAWTADLGARRVREEIDAMQVLGIDPVHTLVLPRVVALTLMTPLLNLVSLTFGLIGGSIAGIFVGGASEAALFNNLFNNLTTVDVWGSYLKSTIFGVIIGVVACYKGLAAQGGPIGVGRAVNQSVVIAFAMIWTINFMFTATMLGLNPQIQVYR
jgi:phospholipid/cholesterol/gamma-HCH transport system permease protein